MTRARRMRAALLAACAIPAAGCVHHAFDRSLRAGRWQDAAVEFRADSGLQRDADALRAAARIHSVPDSATWDPDRALDLLHRARGYTAPGHFPEADSRLETMLRYIVRERAARGAEVIVLRDSLDRAGREAVRLRAELSQLRETSDAYESERAVLKLMVSRLESDLRDREAQRVALRSELDRLKEIDLSRSPHPQH